MDRPAPCVPCHKDERGSESIRLCEELSGRKMMTEYSETNRIGDHIWYVSDIGKFRRHYPDWNFEYDLDRILQEIRQGWEERLQLPSGSG